VPYVTNYFLVTGDCICVLIVQGRSRSLTSAQIESPYYFLLLICDLGSISTSFRDTELRKKLKTIIIIIIIIIIIQHLYSAMGSYWDTEESPSQKNPSNFVIKFNVLKTHLINV